MYEVCERVGVIVENKLNSAETYAVNSNASFPSASVVKIAIACAVTDADRNGTIDLDLLSPVNKLQKTRYCSILSAFAPEQKLSYRNLVGLMLIVSDNPAADALLELVGIDQVDAWLSRNGLVGTNISLGFEDENLGDRLRINRTTPLDCLKLLNILASDASYGNILKLLENNLRNNWLPRLLPDDVQFAHKTGTLNGVMNDIGIVTSPLASYNIVVLSNGVEDPLAFEKAMAHFSAEAYAVFSARAHNL